MNPAAESVQPSPISGLLGCLAIFLSSFCFYFSTVVIRWAQGVVAIEPGFFAFFRFLLGFGVVSLMMTASRRAPRAQRYHLLIGRTLTNCIAVYCFYQAVIYTSVAEANILNMTYPIFVALFSWVIFHRQRDTIAMAMVGVAFAGVWLILAPARIGIQLSNLWGLGSGISAAFAILYLNVSRQYHDANTVLFYMFGLGSIVMYLAFHTSIFIPTRQELLYLGLCGGSGIAGQFLLTIGFRYVTAVEGGVISSSRILLAALLGPYLAAEPHLNVAGWVGAVMILCANVVLAIRKRSEVAV